MEKLLKYLMLMLVATFSLTITSCGGDDDEPDTPNVTTSDIISGDVSANYPIYVLTDTYSPAFSWELNVLYCSYNPYRGPYTNVSIAQIGKVSKLSEIKTAPASGWNNRLPLGDNNGYVLTYTYGGKPYYVRILITLNKSVTGETVGIHYQFQHFNPSNL